MSVFHCYDSCFDDYQCLTVSDDSVAVMTVCCKCVSGGTLIYEAILRRKGKCEERERKAGQRQNRTGRKTN